MACCSYQFGLVLSIGILMMAPHFGTALRCYLGRDFGYNNNVLSLRRGSGGATSLELMSKLMNFTTNSTNQQKGLNKMPTPNGDISSQYCPADQNQCVTIHCDKITGSVTISGCLELPQGLKLEEYCDIARPLCHDPKFYCRVCQTDYCNNELAEKEKVKSASCQLVVGFSVWLLLLLFLAVAMAYCYC